ncbi:MAG: hypothetical protein JNL61_09455 [Rhizobiaceae bacterium]|nr:hypothetical protein [Rhizobiaceae bacterium]
MRALLILIAFLGGFVAGCVAAIAAGLLYIEWAGVFDRDGGLSMGIIFTIGPLAGLIAGLASAALAARRLMRKTV